MPWQVVKRTGPKPWKVVKEGDGKVVGNHSSRASALSQLRALYANVKE